MKLGKFIPDQVLCRLDYPKRNPLPVIEYLEQLGKPIEDSNGEELWPEVNRYEKLRDLSIRRMCVTVEGGVGKTKLLEELEVLTEDLEPGHWVLRFELRELPEEIERFADEEYWVRQPNGEEVRRKPLLIRKVLDQLGEVASSFDTDAQTRTEIIQQLLVSLRSGNVTLIIDAFDQLDKQSAAKRAETLSRFINQRFPKIRCVIAGRPYAIKRVRNELGLEETVSCRIKQDEDDSILEYEKPVWEFCKLNKFSFEQVREYLSATKGDADGEGKLTALKKMSAEEIHLPRTLDIVRQLTGGELARLKTAGDLYWLAMNKLVTKNFRNATEDFQLKHLKRYHVIPIVSSVAFAMLIWKESGPITEVPSVESDFVEDFIEFMENVGFVDALKKQKIDFHDSLRELAKLDLEALQFQAYSETTSTQSPDQIEFLEMSDATIRDFFAAHWATRYFDDQLAATDISLESTLSGQINSRDFERFWQFVVGMPDRVNRVPNKASTESSWVSAVRPLFLTQTQRRPTKLMYRCWPDLLWRAGYMSHRDHVDVPDWNETPMAAGTLLAQREVRSRFEKKQAIPKEHAKGLVEEFLRDYLVQVESQKEACLSDPIVTPDIRTQFYLDCKFVPIDISEIPNRSESSEVERKESLCYLNERYPLYLFERSFREVEGGPFLYGDDPDPSTPKHVDAFEINAYLLSESMYGCFDRKREIADANRARNRFDWYSSLMVSIWSHGRLASEFEWEAASRGEIGNLQLTSHRDYGFAGGETELPQYADFGRDLLEDPSEIGQRYPTTKYEFFDVHGQLWEWCSTFSDEYSDDDVLRVLRGGSFINVAFFARCSYRYLSVPSFALSKYGCRVSRAKNP